MSATYRLYVGPYLEVRRPEGMPWPWLDYDDCENLEELQGEWWGEQDESLTVLGPNAGIIGVDRELSFSKDDGDVSPIHTIDYDGELAAFTTQYANDIAHLEAIGCKVVIRWGIVQGWI